MEVTVGNHLTNKMEFDYDYNDDERVFDDNNNIFSFIFFFKYVRLKKKIINNI